MPHPSPAAFIEATGLIKHLGGHLVLNGASLRLLEGETLAVLGRSGDGKSVLLKHLAGLMMPESGSVRIDGDEIHFTHDRNHDGQQDTNECLGFRVSGTALQAKRSCNASGDWQAITDKANLVVTALRWQVQCQQHQG